MQKHTNLVSGGKNFSERTVSAKKLGRTMLDSKEAHVEKPKEPDPEGL